MRRIVLAVVAAVGISVSAQAADMPVKAAPALFNWSGWYIGGHVGGAWGDVFYNPLGGEIASVDSDGGFGGLQIGYNWQYARNFVFGIEADVSFADISTGLRRTSGGNDFISEINTFGSIRARWGYANSPVLWYVTGGAAWADHELTDLVGLATQTIGSKIHWGYVIGAGVEWAFAPRWSIKVEYLFYDFGDKSYVVFVSPNARVDLEELHTVRLGLNRRF